MVFLSQFGKAIPSFAVFVAQMTIALLSREIAD
jgi:hypothetical protein